MTALAAGDRVARRGAGRDTHRRAYRTAGQPLYRLLHRPPRAGDLRRARRRGLRPGIIASIALHGIFFALIVLATLTRPRPSEPLPPPSYEMVYQSGAPDRPAESEATAPPAAPATEPAPPPLPPPPMPQLAQPAPPPMPLALSPAPPRPSTAVRPAEPAPPPLPPALAEALPLPPPAPPMPSPAPRPQQDAAVIAPPRPARPAPPQQDRLPGIWLPQGAQLTPMPRPEAPRRGLDLSLGSLATTGRTSPEPQVSVRGAQVGPDWRNAFRRWLEENVRYPANAAVIGDEGSNRIQLTVDPDGRVRSGRLMRRSGSVWLDAGLEMPFRNAVLPAFPPGADPNGVEVNLTVHWHIIRQ